MLKLTHPLNKKQILSLKISDKVLLSGTIFTMRDRAHLYLTKNYLPKLNNAIIYHSGPIIKDKKIISAGPTTSARFSAYTPELIKKYNINIIIGKGGMDKNTLKSLENQAVYLAAIGGAAVLYAEKIKLKNIYCQEFGETEAIYEFIVKDFPLIVAMDSRGNSLYEKIEKKSKEKLAKLIC